ncbi:hypothetical protein C8R43DRAFT_953820 [Mycena crocata]|nr:hypothetical protein C8R43DRAFT_953820 [Mycena crocata]
MVDWVESAARSNSTFRAQKEVSSEAQSCKAYQLRIDRDYPPRDASVLNRHLLNFTRHERHKPRVKANLRLRIPPKTGWEGDFSDRDAVNSIGDSESSDSRRIETYAQYPYVGLWRVDRDPTRLESRLCPQRFGIAYENLNDASNGTSVDRLGSKVTRESRIANPTQRRMNSLSPSRHGSSPAQPNTTRDSRFAADAKCTTGDTERGRGRGGEVRDLALGARPATRPEHDPTGDARSAEARTHKARIGMSGCAERCCAGLSRRCGYHTHVWSTAHGGCDAERAHDSVHPADRVERYRRRAGRTIRESEHATRGECAVNAPLILDAQQALCVYAGDKHGLRACAGRSVRRGSGAFVRGRRYSTGSGCYIGGVLSSGSVLRLRTRRVHQCQPPSRQLAFLEVLNVVHARGIDVGQGKAQRARTQPEHLKDWQEKVGKRQEESVFRKEPRVGNQQHFCHTIANTLPLPHFHHRESDAI